MTAILALIGLFVLLWLLSKGLKAASRWLEGVSYLFADMAHVMRTRPTMNKREIQQNKIAEEKLQTITGETSHANYLNHVRQEIEEITRSDFRP